jgi:hypothetical protein
MTSKEFTIWLKGFTEGVHEYNITPKQWDTLKEKLEQVSDDIIPMGGLLNDHNTFRTHPYYVGDTPISNPFTTTGTYTTQTDDDLKSKK